MNNKINEYCGIVGVCNDDKSSNLVHLGLYALQHRGQEGVGIVSYDGSKLNIERGIGLVSEVMNNNKLNKLLGTTSIGHVRYSTHGINTINEIQPLSENNIAIAHNGNLVNSSHIRKKLEKNGNIFNSTSDSEILLKIIKDYKYKSTIEGIKYLMENIKGSYSLLIIDENKLIAVRDPYGFKPLCLGLIRESTYIVSSESCVFDLIGAKFIRDIEPGEILLINEGELTSYKLYNNNIETFCVFECIYFSRPDSIFNNKSVHLIRKELGKQLFKEMSNTDINADLIISVPDSGNSSAIGFSEESNIPYDIGFVRNHYIGRTFIESGQDIRDLKVKLKLNVIKDVVYNKNIIVIDDSIVRATTSKKIVRMLKNAGAKSVFVGITSPPIKHPCFYGIDIPSRDDLIASKKTIRDINKYINSDGIKYLSINGLKEVMNSINICDSCFTGKYNI